MKNLLSIVAACLLVLLVCMASDSPTGDINGKASVSFRVIAEVQANSTYLITVTGTGMNTIGPNSYTGGQTISIYVPEGPDRRFYFERYDSLGILTDTSVTVMTIGSGINTVVTTLIQVYAPQITDHPKPVTVKPGSPAVFVVSVTGTRPFTYQWQRNGLDLTSGGTDSIYLIISTVAADSGSVFQCIVSNSVDADTSDSATLKVTANPTYTVTYNGNGNTSGTVPVDTNDYAVDATATIKTNSGSLVKTGFTFSGWNTKADGTGITYAPASDLIMTGTDVILYAKWTNNPTFTVTYDGNGNDSGTVPVDNNNYEAGATVTAKSNSGSLAKTGFTFSGWNTNDSGTGTTYAAGAEFNIDSANVTLYAKWTDSPTYKVTYDGNGNASGTVPVDDNNYESGTTVIVKNNSGSLVKTGFTFSGWNTKDDGTGTSYAAGSDLIIDTTDVLLYAKWTNSTTYKVTYDGNGNTSGTVPVDNNNYEAGAEVTVKDNSGSLTKTGYTFSGWNTKDDGSGETYSSGNDLTIDSADVLLYAKWTNNPTFKVTYDANAATGGSVPEDANNYETAATVTVKGNSGSLAKTGYTFAGWNTEDDGTGKSYAADDTFSIAAADITLYAKWDSYSYLVTFDSQGATVEADPTSKTVISPATSVGTLPTPPQKTGYNFGGWYTEINGVGPKFTAGKVVTGDIKVYAEWETYSYTVTFYAEGATIDPNPKTITVATPATTVGTLPSPPEKTGYIFGGWYTENNGQGNVFTADSVVTLEMTVYAKWDTYNYTIAFNGQSAMVDPNPTSKAVISPATTVDTLPIGPSKTGFIFAGWYTAINGSGAKFTDTTLVTASDTVYAKWTTLTDVDGNVYTTVTIGTQIWMVENLKTTKFNDGSSISHEPDSAWFTTSTPAYCWYDNDTVYKDTYGALYNWHAVNTGKLAPAGWRVPTQEDMNTLATYLGGYQVAGGKLKEAGLTYWNSPNTGATNESGFSALPGGTRNEMLFSGLASHCYWWLSTEYNTTEAYGNILTYVSAETNWGNLLKQLGQSVRCVLE